MEQAKTPGIPEVPPTRGQGVGMILFGLAFVAGGAYVEWLSFGSPPKVARAPPWLTGIAGLIFIVPGLAYVIGGLRALFGWQSDAETKRIYTGLFQAAMLWLFAIAFGGAAVFATEGFSGGVTGSPIEGRIVFGIFGLAVGLFAIMFSIVVLGAIMARNQKRRDAKPADSESS
jgi:hypothetical protein